MSILIPARLTNATHCTDGLSGYPAIDLFGSLGEDVHIGIGGRVVNPHLIPWRQGFGGWTFYFLADNGSEFFVTHLDETDPVQAVRLEANSPVGRLTRSAAHASLINGAHVHVGNTAYTGPGLNCGAPPGSSRPTGTTGPVGVPHTQFPPGVQGPVGQVREQDVLVAWHNLAHALGRTLPTQYRRVETARKHFNGAIR